MNGRGARPGRAEVRRIVRARRGSQASRRAVAAASLMAVAMATSAAAGTFERWIGSPVGWVSNDAERATLTKRVERFRAKLPGHERALGTGEAGMEVWIHLGCRARDPARAPTLWINLPDHPDQPPAPHWMTDPLGFVAALARHGELETVTVVMKANGGEARATLVRRRVIAWTGSRRPWLAIELERPVKAAAALLGALAGEAGAETIALAGAGTRIELHPRWSAEDRALARDMKRHCPAE